MNNPLLYFAYGSNLHPVRLRERVPSSALVGVAELGEHSVRFHKRGVCGSGKCNAFYTANPVDRVWGAVYRIDALEKRGLDGYEGEGYEVRNFPVMLNGQHVGVFGYIATDSHIDDSLAPFHWYKELVVRGVRYHGLPEDYCKLYLDVTAAADPVAERHARHERLLRRMRNHR